MRRLIGLAVLVVALAGSTEAASSDGGQPGAIAGPDGVTTPQSDVRWVTLADSRNTVVAAVVRNGGAVLRWRSLPGNYQVPGVTVSGSGAGLSAEGGTLVLVRQSSQRRTTLAVFDTNRMTVARRITLRGTYSFDAISPDGGSLYLVQHLSSNDPTRYAVRAYDVSAGRLRPRPIVDPREHGDEMRGFPLSRAYSPDGRWAYTLYDGNGKHPFVHALDTVAGRARCIDTPMLAGRHDLYDLTVKTGPGGRTLSVGGRHGPLASVDTRTFRVTKPAPASAAASTPSGGAGSWPLLGLAGLALAAGAAALRLRRRRRLATG
jgi:hypothetical protein